MCNLENSVIFPKGEKIANDYFIGDTWLEMIVGEDNIYHCPIGNVSFAPGARNNWHVHPGGQILLVTGGKGIYQEENKPAQFISAGDVIKIPPHVKHWHGATQDHWMVHLAISTNVEAGVVTWLEPVNDKQYKEANKK